MNNSLLYFFLNQSTATSGYANGSVPLYLNCINSVSGTVPLYLLNIASISGTLPLYLQGPNYYPSSGTVNLSLQGSTSGHSQTFGSVPIYLYSTGSSGTLNLYLSGQAVTQPTSGYLNLFLNSAANNTNANVNLSLLGGLGSGQNPTTATVPLFIQGLGGLAGSTPTNSYLNLFLQNNYSAATSGVNLYSYGNGNASGIINMYLYGVQGAPTSGVNLYLYGIGVINQSVALFARGYID